MNIKQLFCKHENSTLIRKDIFRKDYYLREYHNYVKCVSCGKVTRQQGTYSEHGPENGFSDEFKDLYNSVAKKLKIDWDDYGSWWHLNFPCKVDQVLQEKGEKLARNYMINCLTNSDKVEGLYE